MSVIPVVPQAVTPAWLSEVLGADVRECRLEQIAIGVGLLGRLFRAHLDGGPGVPATVIVNEREAAGQDGGRYTWTRIFVVESRDGRPTGMCEFDLEDEAAAFAYAEEQVRGAEDR